MIINDGQGTVTTSITSVSVTNGVVIKTWDNLTQS